MTKVFAWGYPAQGADSMEFQSEEFLTYLRSLEVPTNPFSCDNLRVLPEEVRLKRDSALSLKYKVGELICVQRANSGLNNHRCHFESDLVDKMLGLEIKCKLGGVKFRVIPF